MNRLAQVLKDSERGADLCERLMQRCQASSVIALLLEWSVEGLLPYGVASR